MSTKIISRERILMAKEQAKMKRTNEIKSLLEDLQTVRYNIKQFKHELTKNPPPKKQSKLNFQIEIQRRKESAILSRLKNRGYQDKRGRPKKKLPIPTKQIE